jgi:hypothetical protein
MDYQPHNVSFSLSSGKSRNCPRFFWLCVVVVACTLANVSLCRDDVSSIARSDLESSRSSDRMGPVVALSVATKPCSF